MKPEARTKFIEERRLHDKQFYMQLLKDIPYFHKLYAKYHDEKWLALAKELGAHAADLKMRDYKQRIELI